MKELIRKVVSSEWPLFGTHLICLFAGFAVANAQYEPSLEDTLSPFKVLIPVKRTQFQYVNVGQIYSGMRVVLLKKEEEPCLETLESSKVQKKNNSFFVEASKKALNSYLALYTMRNPPFVLIPYERALSYSSCRRKVEVSYGSS